MNLCLKRILPEECTIKKIQSQNLPSFHKIWANILEKLLNRREYEACFANIKSQSAVSGLTKSAISSHSKWYFGIEILSVWIHSSKYHSFSFRPFSLFWMHIYVFCGRLCLFFFCEKVILETSESTPERLISTICSHHSHWNGKQPSAMFAKWRVFSHYTKFLS